jgi:O-antigen ligase
MITRSRAGLALALAGGLASGASAVFDSRGASRTKIAKWSLLAIVAAALLAGQFSWEVMDRVTTDPLQDARLPLARTTLGAALHYLPLGSGFGTFPSVYGIFERPTDLVPGTYANRAHNEFAEVFLEGGVFGIGLILALFVWFVHRSSQIWRRRPGASIKQEMLLARSATIVISLLLLHSLVDYPLRTGAMMAVLGVCCALLIRPKIADTAPSLARAAVAASGSRRQERPVSQVSGNAPWRSDPMRPAKSMKNLKPPESNSRGSDDRQDPPLQEIEWPEAWRNK